MKATVINLDSRADRMETFKKNNFPFDVGRFSGIVLPSGEDGFTKSALTVIGNQKEYPFVVFEDDCIMMESWDVVENAISQLPDDWDALWLGATLTRKLERYSENLYRLRRAYTTHAVIYNSPEMVDFILKNHNTPPGRNLDIFYFSVVQNIFNCFITYPLCATQSEGYSDISKQNTGSWIIKSSYNKYTQ